MFDAGRIRIGYMLRSASMLVTRLRPEVNEGSNQSSAVPLRQDNANVTLALSVEKASGRFLKLRVHWTRNGCNLRVSELSKTSSSQTLVHLEFFFRADRL